MITQIQEKRMIYKITELRKEKMETVSVDHGRVSS